MYDDLLDINDKLEAQDIPFFGYSCDYITIRLREDGYNPDRDVYDFYAADILKPLWVFLGYKDSDFPATDSDCWCPEREAFCQEMRDAIREEFE
jgi:hypothetical protein